jgi:hypothetical protein
MKTGECPPPVAESDRKPILPVPAGRPASEWAQKAEKAREARALGQQLRQGKPVLFPSRRSLKG